MDRSTDGKGEASPTRGRARVAATRQADRVVTTRRADRVATEAALMDAALRLIERDGVLAGLSLREVAIEAGVNRALINRYFGSREALLRAALDASTRAPRPLVTEFEQIDPQERIGWAFREAVREPRYATMVMLLALDGDEQFHPMPSLAARLAQLEKDQAEGVLAEDIDLVALTVIFHILLFGYPVLRSSMARQLGVTARTLDRRVVAGLEQILGPFVTGEAASD